MVQNFNMSEATPGFKQKSAGILTDVIFMPVGSLIIRTFGLISSWMKPLQKLSISSEQKFGTLVRHTAFYALIFAAIGGLLSLSRSSNSSPKPISPQVSFITVSNETPISAKPLGTMPHGEWLGLEVQAGQHAVEISWAYMEHSNSSSFLIERNVNGEGYETIGKINADSETAGLQHYFWEDDSPFDKASIDVFYRIKAIDKQGSYNYSPRSAYRLQSDWIELSNHSQPVSQDILLGFSHEFKEAIELRVVNRSGELFYQDTFEGQYQYRQQLNTHSWPKGQYFAYLDAKDAGRMVSFELGKESF